MLLILYFVFIEKENNNKSLRRVLKQYEYLSNKNKPRWTFQDKVHIYEAKEEIEHKDYIVYLKTIIELIIGIKIYNKTIDRSLVMQVEAGGKNQSDKDSVFEFEL